MSRDRPLTPLSYDASGSVVSVDFNGTEYYYLRNAQGDIVKLIDSTGTVKVQYTYDTWGKKVNVTGTLASTLGTLQPFRYRGYVYDEETGLYYLQSRYYDPEVGRFISADVLLSTGQGVLGHNAFAYCNDNPVALKDEGGNIPSYSVNLTDGGNTTFRPVDTSAAGAAWDALWGIKWFGEGQEQEAIDAFIEGGCTVYYFGARLASFFPPMKTTCSIAGTIFIDPNNIDPDILRHEYGHILHERIIGTISYAIIVGIPSSMNCDKGMQNSEYYSQPWEMIAEILSGRYETNGASYYSGKNAYNNAIAYFTISVIISWII